MKAAVLGKYLLRLPKQTRRILRTCIYGLCAGLAAVFFHLAIHWVYTFTYHEAAEKPAAHFLIITFLVIISTSLAVGYLLNTYCMEARGSGIPQVKMAFWKEFGYIPFRVVWVKFLAGVLSVGGGCSLGREGPSVQLAGGLASNMAGTMGEPKQNRREACIAGAAAGLAAAFNAPLAAVTFVLEEIIEDLQSRFLGSVLLASVIAAFVVYAIIGKHPAFTLGEVGTPTWIVYLLIPFVAAIASLVGILFQRSTLRLRRMRKDFQHVPLWVRPAIGGLITWILGAGVFLWSGHLGVFGLGYEDLSAGLTNQLGWKIAVVLLVTKLIATFCCYGFGGCGGIFAPALFFGGMCGVFFSGILGTTMHLTSGDQILLAVVGMSACLGAVVKAPITSIMIVFEMTHEFDIIPGLMLGTLVSQAVGRSLARRSFYEELLIQDGHNLENVRPPRDLQSWLQLPVSAIANFQPVLLESLQLDHLSQFLKKHPYQCFPVIQDNKPMGVLTRQEAEKALAENRPPKLEAVSFCYPSQIIRELQMLLIESKTGIVLLQDQPNGKVLGLVTLHDLLRAEVSMAREQQVDA